MTKLPRANYTQVPNVVFDEWLKEITGAELRILLVAIRKTLGWHKASDGISISQFVKETGLSRQGVINGIKAAVERGYMHETGTLEDGTKCYELLFEDEAVNSVDGGVVNSVDQGSQLSRRGVVNSVDYQTPGGSQLSRLTKESSFLKKAVEEKDVAAAAAAYLNGFGQTVSPTIAQRLEMLLEDMPLAWIEAAIEEAVLHNARNLKYVEAILERWKRDGRANGKPAPAAAPPRANGTAYQPAAPLPAGRQDEETAAAILERIRAGRKTLSP